MTVLKNLTSFAALLGSVDEVVGVVITKLAYSSLSLGC